MRPILHGDVVSAARVLLKTPGDARGACLSRMMDEARWADAYRKRTGRAHPCWGDGSLMAAALRRNPAAEPEIEDPEYCQCLVLVLEGLLSRRSGPSHAHS